MAEAIAVKMSRVCMSLAQIRGPLSSLQPTSRCIRQNAGAWSNGMGACATLHSVLLKAARPFLLMSDPGQHDLPCLSSEPCMYSYQWNHVQAEGTGNKELEPSEGMGSASQQEPPAEAHGDEQPPEAAHFIRGSRFAALGSLPADSIPASSSREAASSSTSSSLSAQLLLPLHSGTTPRGQREESLPRSVAQAAQAPASDSEDEGPWQEVKASRRKAASQQAFSQAGARKAPSQDRSGPDQEHSATSPSRLGDLQAAAQHAEQGLPKPEKAAVPPQEQPVPDGAEHLPQWLPGLACDQPQQPSQHKNPDSVQHPDCSAGTSLHEQVCMKAC